jgi:hypothetical protein
MSIRFFVAHSILALSVLGATAARAQTVTPNPPGAAPATAPGLPDACKLMPQSDLETLFPGRDVTNKGHILSPIYQGPQYVGGCQYVVKLPSPTSKLEVSKFAMLTIISWGAQSKSQADVVRTFASIRDTREKVLADPKLNRRHLEPLSGVGDEAFLETSDYDVAIRARKDDLIFFLTLDKYSEQTQPNVVALAAQVAKRWRAGAMVEADGAIASNNGVDIPADTRVSRTASADQWPDACALLQPEDVRSVFGDMKVDPPRKTMGQLRYDSRIDRVEDLPKPIRCDYLASKTNLVNGQREVTTNSIEMSVQNVATNVDSSKSYYAVALKVGGADTPVVGLGDEASMDIMNRIYIRKGVLMIAVRVGGGERDQALHDDARRRALEIAKLVAAKLP